MARLRTFGSSSEMPVNQQVAFLETHYNNRGVLFTGFFGHLLACVVCMIVTSDWNFLWFAIWISAVLVLRFIDMRLYDIATTNRTAPATQEFVDLWNARYSAGVFAAAGSLGLVAGYSLLLYPISLASVITVGLACGSMISVVGRNFGNVRNINILTLLCGLPMCIGLMMRSYMDLGSPIAAQLPPIINFLRNYLDPALLYALTAVMLMPLLFVTRQLAKNVRQLLHHAYVSSHRANEASQFLSITLDNMPNGIITLEKGDEIYVHNLNVERYLGVTKDKIANRNFFALIRAGSMNGLYTAKQARMFAAQFRSLINEETTTEYFNFRPGETIEVKAFKTVRTVIEALGTGTAAKMKQFLNEELIGTVFILEDVSERLSTHSKIEQMGRFDALSTLPNRNHFTEVIAEEIEHMDEDSFIALAMFDVDGFKKINDTLGHSAGDQVIVHVAAKMKKVTAGKAILCRTGGDEFVIAYTGLTNDDDVNFIFDRVFSAICTNYVIQGRSLSLKVSGGVTCMSKSDFALEEALKQADFALYETKTETKAGRPQQWQMFSSDMAHSRQKEELRREDLRIAIQNESFHVAYQGMRTPDGSRIQCCEALARWIHPTHGNVPPTEFIKTAEEIGEVSEITRIIINKACREAMAWPSDVSVSVNLSAVDLGRPDIVNVIRKALETSGLPPERLQVEVTETVFVKDIDKATEILHHLRDLGVKTALDDFGTGYSSLSYLTRLPLDKVKIDKSFIEEIGKNDKTDILFSATVQLAKNVGFQVVVEGVETAEQLEAINRIAKVDLIQGYYFGKPVSTSAMKTQIIAVNGEQTNNVIDLSASRMR